jgi:flagellar hook-associated protein 2
VVKAVQGVVDAYNAAYSTLKQFTAYDATTKSAGLLLGDQAASGLLGRINQVLADQVKGLSGSYTSAGSIGISMQADGTFALNQSKLTTALGADPRAVTNLLARSWSAADNRIVSVTGSDSTAAGSYAVVVTRAPQAATVIGGVFWSPVAPYSFTVTSNGTTATVNVAAGANLATVLASINDALKAAGLTQISASSSGGAIQIQSSVYGSSTAFTVAGDQSFGLNGTYAGVDVAGTIDGRAASGTGQILSSSSGGSTGLQVRVGATPTDVSGAGGTLSLGAASFSQGLAGRLSSFLRTTTATTGTITDAAKAYSSQIDTVKKQMASLQLGLTQKEKVLRQRFSAMETALVRLQSQGSFLSQFGATTSSGVGNSPPSSSGA